MKSARLNVNKTLTLESRKTASKPVYGSLFGSLPLIKLKVSNYKKGEAEMKKINSRVVLFVLTVAMFVLGSGAPEAGGGIINRIFTFPGW